MKNIKASQKVLRIASIVVVLWGILLLTSFLTRPKEEKEEKKKTSSERAGAQAEEVEKGPGMANSAHQGMETEISGEEMEIPDLTMPDMPSADISVPSASLPDVSDPSEDQDSQADGSYGYGLSDAMAFSARTTNEGPFKWGGDYWMNQTYDLHYDGSLEITEQYSLSGKTVTSKKVSRDDFDTIMRLIQVVMEERPFDDIDYSDTYDGSTWGFSIYAPTGAETYIYGGYTYGCEDLEEIQKILRSYDEKISLSDRAYLLFEGEYICSSDDQKSIRIYTDKGVQYIELEKTSYRITNVELNEDKVFFEYEENGKKETISFTYSPDKKVLKIEDEDIPYVRK